MCVNIKHKPVRDVAIIYGLWLNMPGTGIRGPRQTTEVKLTADGGLGATGVGHVVGVEGHHVTQHSRVVLLVCNIN